LEDYYDEQKNEVKFLGEGEEFTCTASTLIKNRERRIIEILES
jgi:hypothetical protein